MKHKYKDTIYYSDEQNDDFATTVKNIKKYHLAINIYQKIYSLNCFQF